MNFVFVSLQRINTDRESTSTSLAKELSKNHRVLYVNPPIDRRTWYKNDNDVFTNNHIADVKAKKDGLKKCSESLWELNPSHVIESINWIPNTRIFSFLNYFNNRTFASNIKQAIRTLGFDSFILINDKDIFRSFYLKELLKPSLSVYLDRDYTLGFDYWKRHGIELEPQLMAKSDGVVCNSLDFTKRAKQYNAESYYIGNGGGLGIEPGNSKFYECPVELRTIDRPIIGYVGVLTSHRLDVALLQFIAEHLKDFHIVLIGPEDGIFAASKLHQMSNVTFIERKDKSEIPQYVSFFDVCINPQLQNDITMGNFPLKIVEYLAMGKPVVATTTNTMEEVFSTHTYLANNGEEFISKIKQALQENNSDLADDRIKFSNKFSWENVSNELLYAIEQIKQHGTKG